MRITRGRALSGIALVGAGAILLAGCAAAPEQSGTTPGAASDFLPCIVSDAGGFDDKSFNQLSYEGVVEAAGALGVDYKEVQSSSEADFAPNLESLVSQGCNLIVSVGFALSQATVESALANPDINYAIIDDAADNDFNGQTDAPNIKPILFNTADAAFLAGYAAASYTKTGVVATWGGMDYPTVSIFSDGFAQGVTYFNEQKGGAVKLLGYDPANPTAYTVTGGFEANDVARQTAQNFIDQNADVLLPVGGPIYQSALAAITDSGKDIALVGVDADLYQTDPKTQPVILTSILKQMKVATSEVVTAAGNGDFSNEAYIGTLENDGVGIAGFNDLASKVSPELQGELDTIRKAIISGEITVTSYLKK